MLIISDPVRADISFIVFTLKLRDVTNQKEDHFRAVVKPVDCICLFLLRLQGFVFCLQVLLKSYITKGPMGWLHLSCHLNVPICTTR